MIYDKSGNEIVNVYNIGGEALSSAYDNEGLLVFSKKYTNYTISNQWSGYWGRAQGLAIYGDLAFVWDEGSPQQIKIREVADGTLVASIEAGTTGVHGNDISFSDEFYDQNDEFPLLYVGLQYCFRITESSMTLVRRLSLPSPLVINDEQTSGILGDAFDGNYLYAVGYKYGYHQSSGPNNCIRFAKLNMSNLTEEDGVYIPELMYMVEQPWFPCVQGVDYHDGLVWVASGLSSPGHIYALNPVTADIEVDIPLPDSGELEGLAWGYNSTDGWFMMVGAVGLNKYLKITFAEATT